MSRKLVFRKEQYWGLYPQNRESYDTQECTRTWVDLCDGRTLEDCEKDGYAIFDLWCVLEEVEDEVEDV